MAPDTPVLPEIFRDAGYNTAGVVATMFVSSKYGFERGFDYFQDFGVMDKKTNNLSTVDAEHVFSHALHWAQSQPAETPLFTFLHVYDVHYGYNAPSPWNERFDRAPAIGDAIYRSYFDYLQRMIPDV
jgi:arylsulfatase A-like enzyme